jgi:hypothetical protein
MHYSNKQSFLNLRILQLNALFIQFNTISKVTDNQKINEHDKFEYNCRSILAQPLLDY